MQPTLIQPLGQFKNNTLYIKRDDLLPFSFGGNKARKAVYFLDAVKAADADCIVTYGSSSSNHCRIVANMAASMGLRCVIVSPEEDEKITANLRMMEFFGAELVRCPVQAVSQTIDTTLARLKEEGYNPYFIMGGGHGNLGTQAYADCFSEILAYEKADGVQFDYIFHASGTGTTQAGLICGKLLNQTEHKIVGISIARRNPRGGQVVEQSIRDYMAAQGRDADLAGQVCFVDDYVLDGYGAYNRQIDKTIADVLTGYGIPLNRTYTGKAFWGMGEYLEKENIKNKKILFLHTGGTPLFFDYLKEMQL